MTASNANATQGIVILGGGFGGVYTAYHLEKLGRGRAIEVTLISRDNYFLMTPLLFEAGSSVLEPRHAVTPLRSMLKTTRFIQAEVQGVDIDGKVVRAAPTGHEAIEIPFDQLVVAVGGVTNTSLVPGSENAMTFKTLGDAIFVRNHMIDLFERADMEKDLPDDADADIHHHRGAGLVGVELIGELTEFSANIIRSYHQIDPGQVRFELIEAGPRIIPEMDPELSDYAAKVLTKRGVNVRVNTPVKAIELYKVQLESESIESATIVIATGVRPSPVVEGMNLEKDGKGRIITDSGMKAKGRQNVWALGDCAAIPDPHSPQGRPYLQLAQHMRAKQNCWQRILWPRWMAGRSSRSSIPTKGCSQPLGHFRGVGRVYKFRIYGFIAWWVWRTYYLMQMPKWPRRIRIVIDWTIALFFKNDIVKLDLFGVEHPLQGRKNET